LKIVHSSFNQQTHVLNGVTYLLNISKEIDIAMPQIKSLLFRSVWRWL